MQEKIVEELAKKAIAFHVNGQHKEAEELYRAILHFQPNNSMAKRNLSLLALKKQVAGENDTTSHFFNPIDNKVQVLSQRLLLKKPTIRILHHMARSGGTIISKCLGCMKNIVLLSESHPLTEKIPEKYQHQLDPLNQAFYWFHLFDEEEFLELKNTKISYTQKIKIIHQKVAAQNKILVLRDWSHLDFTGLPFIERPSYSLSQIQYLKDDFEIINFATVRNSIDQWLSLNKLSIFEKKISFEDFLKGYQAFAKEVIKIGFVRYEDFVEDPDRIMKEICQGLDISFDPSFKENWRDYTKITGDVSQNQNSNIKKSSKTPFLPEEQIEYLKNLPGYKAASYLLGYENPRRLNSNIINKLFDKIWVISLTKSTERRQYIAEHLPKFGIEKFYFFDATSAEDEAVFAAQASGQVATFPPCFRCGGIDCGDPNCNNFLTPPQIACFITYLRLWEKISSDSAERLLILEDDVFFHSHSLSVLQFIASEIIAKRLPFIAGSSCLLRLGWAKCSDHENAKPPYRIEQKLKMSNPCHAMTKTYAQELLSRFNGINWTSDIYLHQIAPKPHEAYTIFPPIASELSWTSGKFSSTIHPKEVRIDYLRAHGRLHEADSEKERYKNYVKKKYYRPILITGHPRCGTGYAAELCQQLGLDIGHEKLGMHGISSWMFAVDADYNPYAFDMVARTRRAFAWKYLIMPVRNLTDAIGSVMRESLHAPPSYIFRRENIKIHLGVDLDDFKNPFESAIWSITSWSRILLKQNPDLIFRIENQHENLKFFLIDNNLIDKSKDVALNTKPVNQDKLYKGVRYKKPIIKDEDFYNLDRSSVSEVCWYCNQFGYATPIESCM